MERFGAVVIGGGPAGYVAAIRLSQLGVKTALVEKEELGGECTNYGCIPSKYLITVARKAWAVKELADKGVFKTSLEVDMTRVIDGMRAVVGRLRQGIGYLLREYGAKHIKGFAEVIDQNTVRVTNGGNMTELETENILIATGTEPSTLPTIPTDQNRVVDYRKMLYLGRIPKTLLVVGGGAVGMEIGTAYAMLGTATTVVEVMDQLLPGMDADAARAVKRGAEKIGVKTYLKTTVKSYSYVDGGVEVELSNGEKGVFEYVLVSVGKRPSGWVQGLKNIGVELDEKGFIKTDDKMRSSVSNIYAAGDVTGPPFLAHKSFKQGFVAAEAIAGRQARYSSVIPYGVFTYPEVASVGKVSGDGLSVARFPFLALGRALAEAEEGFVKIFAEQSGGLVGAVAVGPHATEVVQVVTPLIEKGASVDDVANAVYIHPTYAEALGEAAHILLKKAIHYVVK
jgi:dihydrolipoamide dehydrogenase